MKLFFVAVFSLVASQSLAQQQPTRPDAIIQILVSQRNAALDQVAACSADLAIMKMETEAPKSATPADRDKNGK